MEKFAFEEAREQRFQWEWTDGAGNARVGLSVRRWCDPRDGGTSTPIATYVRFESGKPVSAQTFAKICADMNLKSTRAVLRQGKVTVRDERKRLSASRQKAHRQVKAMDSYQLDRLQRMIAASNDFDSIRDA